LGVGLVVHIACSGVVNCLVGASSTAGFGVDSGIVRIGGFGVFTGSISIANVSTGIVGSTAIISLIETFECGDDLLAVGLKRGGVALVNHPCVVVGFVVVVFEAIKRLLGRFDHPPFAGCLVDDGDRFRPDCDVHHPGIGFIRPGFADDRDVFWRLQFREHPYGLGLILSRVDIERFRGIDDMCLPVFLIAAHVFGVSERADEED